MGSIQNMVTELTPVQNLAPTSISGAQKGGDTSRAGYDGMAKMLFGWKKTTATSVAIKIQHSVDSTDGNYIDLAGATGTIGNADGVGSIDFDLRACKLYIRGVATPAGGSTDGIVDMNVLMMKKAY